MMDTIPNDDGNGDDDNDGDEYNDHKTVLLYQLLNARRYRWWCIVNYPVETKIECIYSLLHAKANPNGKTAQSHISECITPLSFAIEHRDLNLCRDLVLRYKANAKSNYLMEGGSPLHCVVCNARYNATNTSSGISRYDEQMLDLLLQNGADINFHQYSEGNSALHFACKNKSGDDKCSLAMIQALLDRGADPNITNAFEETPIFNINKHFNGETATRAIDFLMRSGAHVNHRNEDGDTPLHTAMLFTLQEHTFSLLSHGARVTKNNGEDNAYLREFEDGESFSDVAPKTPMELISVDQDGFLFLCRLYFWLSQQNKTLMDFGADPNEIDSNMGSNPILQALYFNIDDVPHNNNHLHGSQDERFSRLLPKYLEYGCDLNIRYNFKYGTTTTNTTTLLHIAMAKCYFMSTIKLMEAGAFFMQCDGGCGPVDVIPLETEEGRAFRENIFAWASTHHNARIKNAFFPNSRALGKRSAEDSSSLSLRLFKK